ncbi:hypothetical protein BP6252_12385 [Coleophoma cylindrospora]|uniref:C2H2-type domain-containing protein n=1 Tax=Coleophoma cylindrospora TaxID=1849047 RepID=A0A3D8QGQ2_9HELO|nr:hypothetical protein BP6252_12385 [Coleophoma cylindrospora]
MDARQRQQRFAQQYTWSLPAAPEPDMSRTLRTYGGSSIGSGTSSYSNSSNNSQPYTTTGQSISTANTSFDGDANVQYSDYLKPTQYMQISSLETARYTYGGGTVYEEQTSASRPTPKNLGWTPNTRYGELYKVVVSDKKVSHLELLPEFRPNAEIPSTVYLDTVKNSKGYACQFPGGCTGKQSTFTRPADLDRHYIHYHAASSQRENFYCGYKKCQRAKDPFHRKDHYRDHLRDFHKEDLPGKRFVGEEAKRKWLEERKIDPNWWRCTKCLEKVAIGKDLFLCRGCALSCEPDRIASRQPSSKRTSQRDNENAQYKISQGINSATSNSNQNYFGYTESCQTCHDSQYIPDYNGSSIECPVCRPNAYANINQEIGNGWGEYERRY